MKIMLTIVAGCSKAEKLDLQQCDGIEILYPLENEEEKAFAARAAKSAKGKYCILLDKQFTIAEMSPLLNILDKNSTDMISFADGTAIKTSIVRSAAKNCDDLFSCFMLAVLDCDTVLMSTYTPLALAKTEICFTDANCLGLLTSAEAFGQEKSKISKNIYAYALNTLCARLVLYYLYTIVEINEKKTDAEKLIAFDGRLKSEIVLYLALEKNFTFAKLNKLRKKGFKLWRFTVNKFKKLLKSMQ